MASSIILPKLFLISLVVIASFKDSSSFSIRRPFSRRNPTATTPPVSSPSSSIDLTENIRTNMVLTSLPIQLRQRPSGNSPVPTSCQKRSDSPMCPYISKRLLQGETMDSINVRSTSPWHFVETNDPTRIPETIFQACCSCMKCVDGFDATPNMYSREITMEFTVGKRINGRLVPVQEDVAIGCTCVARNL